MIEVSISDGRITIKGHAGYHPGNDIVCSAVSALAYTIVNYIEMNRDYFESFGYRMNSGDTEIAYKASVSKEKIVKETLRAIVYGIYLIADSYPENVKVIGRDKI